MPFIHATDPASSGRSPYSGPSKRLLVAVDIGTTFSACSFSILVPNQVPNFVEINQWPKQPLSSAKVPSVILYDTNGQPKAFAAEATDDDMVMQCEDNGWVKSSWWKLHLRPSHLPVIQDINISDLPPNTTIDGLFADFLRYIKVQLQALITSRYSDGEDIWEALSPSLELILTTPNGWEGSQQSRMRAAAIKAGFVDPKHGRVRFVSEAEAAILYAIDGGSVGDWLSVGNNLILCDCGGGTIDITGYKITGLNPLQLEETGAAQCYLAGAVFVNEAAGAYLAALLRGTEWGDPETLSRILENFEQNAKRKFEDVDKAYWVDVGGGKTIAKLGIQRGRLKIQGETMEPFFAASLSKIKEGIMAAYTQSGNQATRVLLVGGLASSPYVYQHLCAWGSGKFHISRPDGPLTKAVANGALAWALDNSVDVRITKCHYGFRCSGQYDEYDPEHNGRTLHEDDAGEIRVWNVWSLLVAKNTKVVKGEEIVHNARFVLADSTTNAEGTITLYVYRLAQPSTFITTPGKEDELQAGFQSICTFKTNLQRPFLLEQTKVGVKGKRYRDVHVAVCIKFGDTELTARLRWEEAGIFKYGDATVVYDQ